MSRQRLIAAIGMMALVSCTDAKLPLGETGKGEAARAFVDLCVTENHGDGPALFERVKDSGYIVHGELAMKRGEYKAKAWSFHGKRDDVCSMLVEMEHWYGDFHCRITLDGYCETTAPEKLGPFVGDQFEAMSGISYDPMKSNERNLRFNDGRYHIFTVDRSSTSVTEIELNYGGNVGSRVYITAITEPNHNLEGVQTYAQFMEQLREKAKAEGLID